MSVEKLIISHEPKPFTTHLNTVLQNLTNATALGIWCYLSSLPPTWNVNKKQLAEHFNLGRDKLNNLLMILKNCNLIQINAIKNDAGQFVAWNIHVLAGSEFKNQQLTTKENQNTENQYTGKNQNTENPVTGKPLQWKSAPIKEIVDKEIKNKKERARKKQRAPLSPFSPNETNTLLCAEFNLTLKDELQSFENRHKGPKNQYEFERWLKSSKEYHDKKNKNIVISTNYEQKNTEIHSTVPFFESLPVTGNLPSKEIVHGYARKALDIIKSKGLVNYGNRSLENSARK